MTYVFWYREIFLNYNTLFFWFSKLIRLNIMVMSASCVMRQNVIYSLIDRDVWFQSVEANKYTKQLHVCNLEGILVVSINSWLSSKSSTRGTLNLEPGVKICRGHNWRI